MNPRRDGETTTAGLGRRERPRLASCVLLSLCGLSWGIPAAAQTSSRYANTSSSTGSSSAASTSSGTSTSSSAASFMPMVPFPMMMGGNGFGGNNTGLSPTDAAALGSGAGIPQSNNVFNNPMAAPFIAGSMMPMQQSGVSTTGTSSGGILGGMSTNQLGLLMLANQAQMSGIGSGQLSGARPGGAAGRAHAKGVAATDPRARRNPSQPLGLAGHYFNRLTPETKVRRPQSFYNRQNQYFPQTPH